MRKLAKTKSLKLEQFFLAGFFAFIARPTLSYFIEKVMRSSLTLISKIVASSGPCIVATSISSEIPIYTVEAPLYKPLKPISEFNPVISKRTKRFQKQQNIVAKRGGLAYYIFKAIPKIHHKFHSFLLNLHFRYDRFTASFHDINMNLDSNTAKRLSTTLQNGSLITSETTCQEPSFFRCFSS